MADADHGRVERPADGEGGAVEVDHVRAAASRERREAPAALLDHSGALSQPVERQTRLQELQARNGPGLGSLGRAGGRAEDGQGGADAAASELGGEIQGVGPDPPDGVGGHEDVGRFHQAAASARDTGSPAPWLLSHSARSATPARQFMGAGRCSAWRKASASATK